MGRAFLILGVERFGFRPLEAVITGFVAVVAVSYLIETFLDKPDWGALALSFAPPRRAVGPTLGAFALRVSSGASFRRAR